MHDFMKKQDMGFYGTTPNEASLELTSSLLLNSPLSLIHLGFRKTFLSLLASTKKSARSSKEKWMPVSMKTPTPLTDRDGSVSSRKAVKPYESSTASNHSAPSPLDILV
jgi:hypothetical protein